MIFCLIFRRPPLSVSKRRLKTCFERAASITRDPTWEHHDALDGNTARAQGTARAGAALTPGLWTLILNFFFFPLDNIVLGVRIKYLKKNGENIEALFQLYFLKMLWRSISQSEIWPFMSGYVLSSPKLFLGNFLYLLRCGYSDFARELNSCLIYFKCDRKPWRLSLNSSWGWAPAQPSLCPSDSLFSEQLLSLSTDSSFPSPLGLFLIFPGLVQH